MNIAREIVLPPGTTSVTALEIPRLIALAIHPYKPPSPPMLMRLDKRTLGPNGAFDGPVRPCTHDNIALMTDIAGNPPATARPFNEPEWKEYAAKIENSPRRPPWNPAAHLFVGDPGSNMVFQADAEEQHERELRKAIEDGSLVAMSHALVPFGKSSNINLAIAYVSVEALREYAMRFGIHVRTDTNIIIEELADRISRETANRHPDKWEHPTDPDPIRRTIVAAMNMHGWPPDGIPGVLTFICNEIESGRTDAYSTFNDLPCQDVSLIRANPGKWYVTRNAEAQIIEAIADAVRRSQGRVREQTEQYERQRMEKEAAGRYTLEEAAKMIATDTGEREKTVLAELVDAVTKGKLTVHEPGKMLPYRPATVRKFYEETYWNDLNAWLDGIKFRNPWRFPPPNDKGVAPSGRPQLQSQYHDQEIMRVIGELSWKPLELPKYGPGIKGARGIIRAKLPHLTDAQFKHSWDRLTGEPKRIGYAS